MKTLLSILCLLSVGTAFGQTNDEPRQMAKPGDQVWVWSYPVKADKRSQYEHFVHDVFYKGASKLSGNNLRALRQTRVMHPTKANPDGSYTYLFIMDPVVKGEKYDIETLVKKMYGPEEGAKHYKLFEDALAGKDVGYMTIQSKD